MKPIQQNELNPIGIMPEWLWKQLRYEELEAAMKRYVDAQMQIPSEWMHEYLRLREEVPRK